MSRNIRQKYPAKTAKTVSKRRGSDTSSSSFDLSDDDGYSAVEEISDSSDDDEEDVDAVEERNILTEAKPSQSPRPQQPESDSDDEEEEENNEDDGDDDYGQATADVDADESTSWAGIVSEVDESQASDFFNDPSFGSDTAVERHVRFDVPSSDSDSTETDDDDDHGDLFPDIFVSQTSLDPAFRREIEHDPDESSGSGSFWDYNGHYDQQIADDSDAEEVIRELSDDETPTATPRVAQIENSPSKFIPAFEESLELDGYESESWPSQDLSFEFIPLTLRLYQLMVIPLRKMFQTRPFEERLAALQCPLVIYPTLTSPRQSKHSVANPASGDSIWTAQTRSQLRC
jgi:hypothetical protein